MDMRQRIDRLENPVRLAELNAHNTLERVGLKEGFVCCDIGAGTGVFSFAAAKRAKTVYALDTSAQMVDFMRKHAEELHLRNVITHQIEGFSYPLADGCCDLVLISLVLHELEENHMQSMLREVKRILKTNGQLAIIEFHDRQTPLGPPDGRLGRQALTDRLCTAGFTPQDYFELGANFYCLSANKA
ncbi:MAG: class I SAM-dependent methyltransferase [Christensenellales bacterium]|jgi:ubiquinone/menaquinone biosynthesis C-methylase UbiE